MEKLPKMGLGTFPYRDELYVSIPNALKVGYKLIDTSDDYLNQVYIGDLLRNDKIDRDSFILSTKISWPISPSDVEQRMLHNQYELGLIDGTVDILLLHFPYPYIYIDIWKEIEELHLNGKCKMIGVCNFEVKHLKKLLSKCRIKPMFNQIELHPLFRQPEICGFCEEHGIRIMSYSPLARMNARLFQNEQLELLAEKYSKSIAQVILRWNIQHEYIPIPATANLSHAEMNIDIFDFELTDDEMLLIDSLDEGMRIRYNPNTMFSNGQKIKGYIGHIEYILKKVGRFPRKGGKNE